VITLRTDRYGRRPRPIDRQTTPRRVGDLISYQNDGKFGVFIVGNVEKA
jgi:hypothetical protein